MAVRTNATSGTIARLLPYLLSLAVMIGAVVSMISEPLFVVSLRNAVFDAYQRLQPRTYEAAPVRIVDVDEETLKKVGQWPWPRIAIAELIERLQVMGAAAIALDIVFAEPDGKSPQRALEPWKDQPGVAEALQSLESVADYDAVLGAVIGNGGVITGFTLAHDAPADRAPAMPARIVTAGDDPAPFVQPDFSGTVTNLPIIAERAAGNGAFSFVADTDGVIRHVPLLVKFNGKLYPSLAAEALRVAQGADNYLVRASGASGEQRFGGRTGLVGLRIGNVDAPTDPQGHVWLHYTKPVSERTVPAWRIFDGSVPEESIAGSIIFIGTSAKGLMDLRFNPLGAIMPGVEAHAQLAEQLILGNSLNRPDLGKAAEVLFIALMWLILVLLLGRLSVVWSVGVTVVALAAACGASWYAFAEMRLLFDPLTPSVAVILVFLSFSIPKHLAKEQEERWIKDAFSSYVSPNLVAHMMDHPDSLSLGGEMRQCSFVMTDLAGFTGFMEKSGPEAVVTILNDYLDQMVAIAFRHHGTLDRFVGDAVAVIFAAPVYQDDHARRAVACALEMDAFAQAFAEARRAEGIPFGNTRIGVHTGEVLVGNFGGGTMFDYRALGDPINTASRLESVNKQLGTRLCVSIETAKDCPDFVGRPVGELVLKGKTRGLMTYEPLTPERSAQPTMQAYRIAYELMEAGDPTALAAFDALADDDPLARFHADRLARGNTGTRVVLSEK